MKTQKKLQYFPGLIKKRKNPDNNYEIVKKVKYYLDDSVPSTKEIAAPDFDEITTFDLYYNQTRVSSLVVVPEKSINFGKFNNIVEVIVYDDYRRKGFGKYLLNYVTKLYSRKNEYPIILRAEPFGNKPLSLKELIKFYENSGFRVINKQNWMIYDP